MEAKNETTEGKGKLKDYLRWFLVGAFGLIILFTVIMAVYRKFGGQERTTFQDFLVEGQRFLVDFPQLRIFFGEIEFETVQSPDIDQALDHSEQKQ